MTEWTISDKFGRGVARRYFLLFMSFVDWRGYEYAVKAIKQKGISPMMKWVVMWENAGKPVPPEALENMADRYDRIYLHPEPPPDLSYGVIPAGRW